MGVCKIPDGRRLFPSYPEVATAIGFSALIWRGAYAGDASVGLPMTILLGRLNRYPQLKRAMASEAQYHYKSRNNNNLKIKNPGKTGAK
jgi:hypothetical protein